MSCAIAEAASSGSGRASAPTAAARMRGPSSRSSRWAAIPPRGTSRVATAVSAEAKIPKHLLCDFAAEVGIDEDSFELIESVAIYLLVDGDEIIDSFAEVLTSARNSVTHPPEEGAFTFFCLFFLLL